mmetsp:Transcript_24098/g.31474  ORF Transcript_24098/g.31474 Transcript_24098/m.31474 type:complete len:264 (+) Transcript_24098:57-848(+)
MTEKLNRFLLTILSIFLLNEIVFSFSSSALQSKLGSMEAVLWDVDGTLSNSYNLGFVATNEVLKRNGYEEINSETYHCGTRYSTPVRFSWHVSGDSSGPNEEGIKLGLEFDELYIGKVTAETTGFYPGIKDIVKSISSSGYRQGALSNAAGDYVRSVLVANGISEVFEVQLGADEVEAPKPSPEGLLQCCREMNINPSLCVYVGDSPSDGEAAKAAGMKSIGVAWGSHAVETITSKFDEVVHDVSELQQCLSLMGIEERAINN